MSSSRLARKLAGLQLLQNFAICAAGSGCGARCDVGSVAVEQGIMSSACVSSIRECLTKFAVGFVLAPNRNKGDVISAYVGCVVEF